MAIGMGRIFGFRFLENFKHPYAAISVADFYKRWHMSLGRFFRDYVYIPMGGNKKNGYLNLFVVWGLTGLWHGANWNFIFWGLFFGILIMLERLITFKRINKVPGFFLRIYLLLAVVLGWALFYFTDSSRLLTCFKSLFHVRLDPLKPLTRNTLFFLISLNVLSIKFFFPKYNIHKK